MCYKMGLKDSKKEKVSMDLRYRLEIIARKIV